ncbi:hypothetical protein [uncultured Selenomonas sp.]|uniref:hypothetical protein n=1 Tax=uncultured Selenomonas sp. TaxID=159275 RepID=UPI0028F0CBEC|nr:hypothetical protein [uncultured Selenomonas sp.]
MAEAKGQTDSRRGYLEVDGSGAMTELVFLLELSGPMVDLESDVIDGFNDMIARLREERSDLLVWLWKEIAGYIDHKKITHCIDHNTRVPITEESALIEQGCFTRLLTLAEEYRRAHPEEFIHQDNVRGSGCLFGVGGSIHMARQVYQKALPEDRPMRTMVIIVTDNTKIEPESGDYWTPERLRALVQQQEEKGWEFILLGANIDAERVAGDIGIPAENAATFACDAAGVRTNFEALGAMISSFAKGAGIPPTWSAQITEYLKKHESDKN